MHKKIFITTNFVALLSWFSLAFAQTYPSRPIRVILPQAPGAGIDLVLRRMSDDLQQRLGQPLLVENRPGGNSVPGADACAKAAPDGHTLCALNVDALAINSVLFAKLPYDPIKDFRSVSSLFTILGGVLVRGALPANNIKELQAMAVAKPGALNVGTLGPNTINDLSRQWLADHWKTNLASIPYKGGPPILAALAAGEIDMTYQGVYVALGLAKAGKVRVLAVSGTRRLAQFPDAPTLIEIGANDLPSARAWWGISTQSGVADVIVRRVNAEIVRLYKEPGFGEFLASQVTEGNAGTPEQFDTIIADTRERVAALFKRYNIEKQ
ncbi:MAG: Bug family tripartite tricarboxylate transporter substrate binding protein [Burkholderiales bacterium]